MALPPGTRIGVFEIVSLLGEGGMGQVYRARDTRLDRDVAVKVLPELFTIDADRVARFEREAKVLAQLNHPNIAHIYGFEAAAIAMELVEGPTLEDLIRDHAAENGGQGLPLDRALAIARQIAIALETAHDQGIIHRDLKPANVKVRDDGTVKILDFGLAKAFAADAESQQSAVSNSPTLTARSTQLGMIIGTAAYMSPEQAKARPVDRRADVWAFGAVLFEMLAGRRAFEGDDVSDVLASVLKTDPDWTALPADLPPPVRRLLRRCLEKDPKKRLRDVGEGMLQLDEGLAAGSLTSTITAADLSTASGLRGAQPLWRRALPVAATAAATAGIMLAIGIWRAAPPVAPAPMRSLHVPPPTAPLFATITQRDLAISPDGRRIAYIVGGVGSASAQIHVRVLDQLEAQPLRGATPAVAPFFSFDGDWVGYVDQSDQTQLKKVSVLGGPPVAVTRSSAGILGASWTDRNTIVFGVRASGLWQVGDAGGAPAAITALEPGEAGHSWPSAVPGTDVVLFGVIPPGTGVSSQLAAVNLSSKTVARFRIEGFHPRYVSSGHIVYATTDGTLRAVAFDPARMELTGTPVPVAEGVGVKPSGGANFDISTNGHLIYTAAGSIGAERTLVWVDRGGRETPIAAPKRNYFYARVSPDGTRLSLDARDAEQDIWIWDLKRGDLSRLTDKPGPDQYGIWAGNDRVVFASAASGRMEVFRHRPDGVGQPEQISDSSADRLVPFPNAIVPGGREVIFRAANTENPRNDLWIADIATKRIRKLLATEHDERNAELSHDGAFMAFESDLSGGRIEVFVRPFPNVDDYQRKVSTDGGAKPVWSRDGRELFYVAGGKLMAVPVTRTAAGIEFGTPAALFETTPYFFGAVGRNYDVAPDGRRFVMVKNPSDGAAGQSLPITIVMNWIEELRARAR